MRSTLLHAVALFFATGAVAFAQEGRSTKQPRLSGDATSSLRTTVAQEAKPLPVVSTKDATKHKRVVCRLRTVPAEHAGRVLAQAFQAEGFALRGLPSKPAAIVADAVTNSLIVSGEPGAVDEVWRLIEELDQPAAMIRFEIVIAETSSGAGGAAVSVSPSGNKEEVKRRSANKADAEQLRVIPKPEQMEVLVRSELTALDNQPASLQLSRREPRVTGVNASRMGTTNNITFENMGTRLALTPRVSPDKTVTVQLDVSDSRSGPAEEATLLAVSKDGPTIRTPSVEALTFQGTVRIVDGETVALAGISDRPKPGKQRFILVTARVLPISVGGR